MFNSLISTLTSSWLKSRIRSSFQVLSRLVWCALEIVLLFPPSLMNSFFPLSPPWRDTTASSPSSSWWGCCAVSRLVWPTCPTWATSTETWLPETSWSTAIWCVKSQTLACPEYWRTTRRPLILQRYLWHNHPKTSSHREIYNSTD